MPSEHPAGIRRFPASFVRTGEDVHVNRSQRFMVVLSHLQGLDRFHACLARRALFREMRCQALCSTCLRKDAHDELVEAHSIKLSQFNQLLVKRTRNALQPFATRKIAFVWEGLWNS